MYQREGLIMRIAENVFELIGNTPLVKINKLNTGNAVIVAKLESFTKTVLL